MASIRLAPFDPSRDFIVNRLDLLCNGRRYSKGDPFDPAGVKDRIVRMLYDQRAIGYVSDDTTPRPSVMKPMPLKSEQAASVPNQVDRAEALFKAHTKAALLDILRRMGQPIDTSLNKSQLAAQIVSIDGDLEPVDGAA
jgi:hypothetical protein